MYETERCMDSNGIHQCTHVKSIAECFLDRLLAWLVDRLRDFPLNDQRPIGLVILFRLHRLPVPAKLIVKLLLIYRHSFCPFTVDLVHAIGS